MRNGIFMYRRGKLVQSLFFPSSELLLSNSARFIRLFQRLLPSAHNRRGSNTQKGVYKRSARYVFVTPLFDPKRRGFELVCFDPSDFQHCAPSLPVRPLSRIRMFRHSQGDFRTDRKPCISIFQSPFQTPSGRICANASNPARAFFAFPSVASQ